MKTLTLCHHICNVVMELHYIEDIQIFGMNMAFISLNEAKKKCIFHEWWSEIFIFSLHEMK